VRSYDTTNVKLNPRPTPDQLAWLEQSDIGFLIHYNMATYIPVEYD
ncbi:unnamed protein product, partial [Rotaria magnacalcarata]